MFGNVLKFFNYNWMCVLRGKRNNSIDVKGLRKLYASRIISFVFSGIIYSIIGYMGIMEVFDGNYFNYFYDNMFMYLGFILFFTIVPILSMILCNCLSKFYKLFTFISLLDILVNIFSLIIFIPLFVINILPIFNIFLALFICFIDINIVVKYIN